MTFDWHNGWYAIMTSPYLGLFLTLLSFQVGVKLYQKSHQHLLLHPVLVSVLSLIALLTLTGLNFKTYYASAQWLNHILGPVIVALAVPLYENVKALRRYWLAFLLSTVLGGTVTILVAVAICWGMDLSTSTTATMWTKSITTAIAMEVAPGLGGIASLAAAMVMITGILGAMIGPLLLKWARVTHPAAQGTALGVCAHAVGTARALELGSEQGAFAALSMSVMGLMCALTLPYIIWIIG